MLTSDFDYNLPENLIAQEPCKIRDKCKMLVLHKDTGDIEDKHFFDIVDYLNEGDLIVANETRVMPSRLIGKKRGTGGVAEVFLLRPIIENVVNSKIANWEVLVKPGKRLKPNNNAIVDFEDEHGDVILSAEIIDWADKNGDESKGERIARLSTDMKSLDEAFHVVGNTPLPPYIHNYNGDKEMYQTVYSITEKSAAAPTAGLHFTNELIQKCKNKGVNWTTVDLQVGLDTFRTVDEKNAEDHKIHTEKYSVPKETAELINRTKENNKRIFAIGTTSVRSLESAYLRTNDRNIEDNSTFKIEPCYNEKTSLYLIPGSKFNVTDALVTNFHVPKSTLMMLVSAFSSRDLIMRAYLHAIDNNYRFLSFGDAMLII